MESMLGNSNSDYPLFRLQKKVDFYESIGGMNYTQKLFFFISLGSEQILRQFIFYFFCSKKCNQLID